MDVLSSFKRNVEYTFYTKIGGLCLEFEFDPVKSQVNAFKHGIDFVEAQALWLDVRRVEIPARSVDESRFVVIGLIGDRHWSAVVTYRGTRVRIISVRRSRREEVAIYES